MEYPYIEISHRYDELFREFVTHYIDSKVAQEYADEIRKLTKIPSDVRVELGGKQTHKDAFGREIHGWTEVCVTFPLKCKGGIIGQDYDIGIAFDNKTGEISKINLGVRVDSDPENLLKVLDTINQIKNLKETEELKAILEKIDTETRNDVFF